MSWNFTIPNSRQSTSYLSPNPYLFFLNEIKMKKQKLNKKKKINEKQIFLFGNHFNLADQSAP